jgi:hypothetical protein
MSCSKKKSEAIEVLVHVFGLMESGFMLSIIVLVITWHEDNNVRNRVSV